MHKGYLSGINNNTVIPRLAIEVEVATKEQQDQEQEHSECVRPRNAVAFSRINYMCTRSGTIMLLVLLTRAL